MYYLDKTTKVFCEWGSHGIEALRVHVDVFVIVDVLSFSTCVDIAVARDASVYPYAFKDESAKAFARELGGVLASPRRSKTELSLSSYSLQQIDAGTRLVLPSPNGSTLSSLTGAKPTFTGCLRNASAVARAAGRAGTRIGVIPAGERWPDGSIRFALEDWLGAGAIIAALEGKRTPEANVAATAFVSCGSLSTAIASSQSGLELIERGFAEDVELAAMLNVSSTVPRLVDRAYVNEGL